MDEHFSNMYDLHGDGIYRFCLMKLSDPEAARDTVQECFMRFWDTLRKGTSVGNDRALLFTIARRLVIDRYRVKGRTTSLDALSESFGFDPPDLALGAENEAEGARALTLIARLPEPYRDVLELRFVEGLEPREIAEIIGENANAVTVRIHRGIAKLREILHTTTPQSKSI